MEKIRAMGILKIYFCNFDNGYRVRGATGEDRGEGANWIAPSFVPSPARGEGTIFEPFTVSKREPLTKCYSRKFQTLRVPQQSWGFPLINQNVDQLRNAFLA